MSNLVDHARRELSLFETDQDYIDGVCKVMQAFADMGHSGGSASVAIPQIYKLLQFRALTPLTDDPKEWIDHSEISSTPFWQNGRDSTAFSKDGGKTYYLLDELIDGQKPDKVKYHTSEHSIKNT